MMVKSPMRRGAAVPSAGEADAGGKVEWAEMEPDRHWSMKLETPETLLREMGLTLIPPAAMGLRFGRGFLNMMASVDSDMLVLLFA